MAITDRVSEDDNESGLVRLSVRLFPISLLIFARVDVMTTVRRGSKLDVIGQNRWLGLWLR